MEKGQGSGQLALSDILRELNKQDTGSEQSTDGQLTDESGPFSELEKLELERSVSRLLEEEEDNPTVRKSPRSFIGWLAPSPLLDSGFNSVLGEQKPNIEWGGPVLRPYTSLPEERWITYAQQLNLQFYRLLQYQDQYAIILEQVDIDGRTALMIKNIPNKYSEALILEEIDARHRGEYDFFYLPVDPKNGCNVGYAFINFLSTASIVPFYKSFNGRRWKKFNSEKKCELKYARMQGKQSLIQHFHSVRRQQKSKVDSG